MARRSAYTLTFKLEASLNFRSHKQLEQMMQGYPDDWDDRRRAVYQRDGYTCQMCGISGGKKGGATLDAHHMMPKSKGGQHQLRMLLTLCRYCHRRMDYFMESPSSPRDCFIKSVSSPALCEAKHEAGGFKKGPIIPAIRYTKSDKKALKTSQVLKR